MALDVTDQALRHEPVAPPKPGDPIEVFIVALQLGLTAFGGPIAHLGYFERIYVERRRWLSAEDYAGLVALCQMLPGPTSSQVGFLVGLRRAGWLGAAAAWVGFTLPSAALMVLFAYLSPRFEGPLAKAALHGLNLVAVAVVAQAVWSMARKLCPDLKRAAIGSAAAAVLLIGAGSFAQVLVLVSGGVLGVLLCRREEGAAPSTLAMNPKTAWIAGGLFLVVLAFSLWPALSIAPGRWCSAEDMLFCRCCETPWSRQDGCLTKRFYPDTVRRRLSPAHSSPSRPISARSLLHTVRASGLWRCGPLSP
jgi:chromate transporter